MTSTVPALPFPVTPRRPGDAEPDLFGFSLVHRALRSGCRLLADAATRIAAGEPCPPGRQRAVVRHAGAVLHEVHVHHSREDDVLWPVIVASAGDSVDLGPLSDDHTALQGVLDRAQAALARFAEDGPAQAGPLAAVLTELADELDEHIEEEEREVFPVVRRFVSAGDFARVETRFRKGTSPRHMVFVLPWIVDACRTPGERARLFAGAPAPLRLLLTAVQRRWTRRRDLVAGG
ncbi:hemerythrin domain-containing protein [Geodermatophilus sp. SYSU D00684]